MWFREAFRGLIAPEERWVVATGAAQRNPWKTSRIAHLPRRGRGSAAQIFSESPAAPPGRNEFLYAFHGLRCASPVATTLRPIWGEKVGASSLMDVFFAFERFS